MDINILGKWTVTGQVEKVDWSSTLGHDTLLSQKHLDMPIRH